MSVEYQGYLETLFLFPTGLYFFFLYHEGLPDDDQCIFPWQGIANLRIKDENSWNLPSISLLCKQLIYNLSTLLRFLNLTEF